MFIWMLYMFHTYVACVYLDIAYVLQWFQVFLQVFQVHILSVSSVFRRMLQVLHLDVSNVDRVLHLSPHLLLPCLGISSSSRRRWHGPHVRRAKWSADVGVRPDVQVLALSMHDTLRTKNYF